ncbi:hypothetical protein DPSP01_002693 [Paraphaeosphaeria sporulosa]
MIYVERYRYLSRLDSTRDVELSRRRPRPGSCIFVQLKQARSVRAYHAKMHTVSSRLEGGRIGAFPVGATPEMGLRSVFGTGSATRRAKGNVRLVRWRWWVAGVTAEQGNVINEQEDLGKCGLGKSQLG